MKKNPILFTSRCRHLWGRYLKLKGRLEKVMKSGAFYRYSQKKRRQLLERLQRYARQLAQKNEELIILAKGSLTSLLLTGTMTTLLSNAALAQSFVLTFPSDIGSKATPTFVDLDGDGDLDAFIGESSGNTIFFENTGTSNTPAFGASQTNPYGLVDIGGSATPSFVDLDGDGDLDALIGNRSGNTIFFENTGSSVAPAFGASQTNPFGLASVNYYAAPCFVDIDGDGDLDALIWNSISNMIFFENTGSSVAPAFGASQTNPFGLANIGFSAIPNFVDIDGDEDLDALVGNSEGHTIFFENTGSSVAPAFGASQTNPFGLADVGSRAAPSFVDIDGDSDLDALIGESGGNIIFFKNIGSTDTPTFSASSTNFIDLPDIGISAEHTFVDIDGDGDFDAFIGNRTGNTIFFENTGSTNTSAFGASTENPFGLVDVGLNAIPNFVDIDGDGDFDAFIGNSQGNTIFFENTGSTDTPTFGTSQTNPYNLKDVGVYAAPTFVDIDGDGDLDAFIGESNGNTVFFENTGSTDSPAFSASIANPFGLEKVGDKKAPNFVDIDRDGDLDAFIGKSNSKVIFFENTGSTSSPAFGASTANSFGLTGLGSNDALTFVDIDADGDIDAFIGEVDGRTVFLKNTQLDVNTPPEITLMGNGTDINYNASTTNPDNDTNFGARLVDGDMITKTFTIQNTGTGGLLLGENAVSINGTHKDDFSILTQPNTIVNAAESTTFSISFDPSDFGERTAEISINNSDADENPFNFAIKGTGAPKGNQTVSDSFIPNPADADVPITISSTENGVMYELKTLAGASLSPAITGTGDGSDLVLTILKANAPTSNTTYKVVASFSGVETELTDQAVVTVININDADADANNEIQTLDVSELDGTTLKLSLSNDGEATKEISLTSLQDGTGTDNQTAAEVPFSATGNTVATNTQAAIVELQTEIDANTDKISANGSVNTHSDVTDAGSGKIITNTERTALGTALQAEVDGSITNEIQDLADVIAQDADANASTITNLLAINSSHGAKLTETGIWMNASDKNRKTNIEGLEYGLEEIMKLIPVEYNYKNNGSHSIGFIAQQVEKILPELVEGKEGDKSLAYSLLTSVIVKAMQEMQVEHEEQELEIDTLQSMVHQLQSENAELKQVNKRMAKLEKLVGQLMEEDTGTSTKTADQK